MTHIIKQVLTDLYNTYHTQNQWEQHKRKEKADVDGCVDCEEEISIQASEIVHHCYHKDQHLNCAIDRNFIS